MAEYEDLFPPSDRREEFSRGGIRLATVTNINDPQKIGRIKCAYITDDQALGETGWIHCLTPFGGSEYGFFFHPNVGDIAALAFEHGDLHRPYALGYLWLGESVKAPLVISGGENKAYRLLTPNKSMVDFNDTEKKEKITLSTPLERKLTLDDGEKKILLTDGSNAITLKSENGIIEITAAKKIILKAGSVTITCDGNAGSVKIDAGKEIKLSSAQISVNASSSAEVSGSGSASLKSSGCVTVKGSVTKIN